MCLALSKRQDWGSWCWDSAAAWAGGRGVGLLKQGIVKQVGTGGNVSVFFQSRKGTFENKHLLISPHGFSSVFSSRLHLSILSLPLSLCSFPLSLSPPPTVFIICLRESRASVVAIPAPREWVCPVGCRLTGLWSAREPQAPSFLLSWGGGETRGVCGSCPQHGEKSVFPTH